MNGEEQSVSTAKPFCRKDPKEKGDGVVPQRSCWCAAWETHDKPIWDSRLPGWSYSVALTGTPIPGAASEIGHTTVASHKWPGFCQLGP